MPERLEIFERRARLDVGAEEAIRWHGRPGAFERLLPPWARVDVLERTGGIRDGGRIVLDVHAGPFRRRWVAEHRDYVEGRQFRDVQIAGPFGHWSHTHSFEPAGPDASVLVDRIEYALPLAPLLERLAGRRIRRRLDQMFEYRHRTTADDLAAHRRSAMTSPMTIVVTGSTGLVGSALVPFLTTGGHRVIRLTRGAGAGRGDTARWDPDAGTVDPRGLEGVDAVVHLAGENIAGGLWTRERKRRIRESRVRGTRVLAEALARLEHPPRVLVAASATGYYGSRGDEVLREESAPGSGFLAEVCRDWEAATEPAARRGVRVVHLRTGIVLSGRGGALAKMLLPFKLGLGGPLGSGAQWVSWIAIDDLTGVILHAIATESLKGPVNAVAPTPVTNRELARTLGRVLGRPALLPAPALALRLVLGAMAEETVLASARVEPARLRASGFAFRHPTLEDALRHQLGGARAGPGA